MNNTTTYKRSMFGLTEINADIINANDLILSGPLQTDLIQSTVSGHNLTLEALGVANVVLRVNSIPKINISTTDISLTNTTVKLNTSTILKLYNETDLNSTNIQNYGTSTFFNNFSATGSYAFQINSNLKLSIGVSSIDSQVYITAPTEVAGSNNTRLATTAFVSSAISTITSGLPTLSGSNTWTGTNTFNTNLPTSTITATTSTQLTNKTYVDSIATNLLAGTNTWTGSNVFNTNLPKSILTPTISNELCNKYYVDSVANLLPSNNTWTGTNLFNNDVTIGIGKKLTADETWCKYYSTHDFTDTIGVGYFKSWFYNNGSIGYISTVDPLYGTSTGTEIRIKVSTNDYKFSNYGLSLNWKNLDLIGDIQLPTYSSVVTTLNSLTSFTTNIFTQINYWIGSNYYNTNLPSSTLLASTDDEMLTLGGMKDQLFNSYNKNITIQDDFLQGFVNNPIAWTNPGTGTTAVLANIQYHPGIVRLTTTSGQNVGIIPSTATTNFNWAEIRVTEWVFRFTGTDVNCSIITGFLTGFSSVVTSVYWGYTLAAGLQALVNGVSYYTAPTIIVTNNWIYTRISYTPAGIIFYCKNLNSGVDGSYTYTGGAIITGTQLIPIFKSTNGIAATKTYDIDYFSMTYQSPRT